MSFTYAQYVVNLANMLVIPPADTNYVQALPSIIDDAEQRIYRELNLLATVIRDNSAVLTANSRNFTLPQSIGRFITVTGMNVVTPVGNTVTNGTRNPLQPAWRNLIDYLFPTETAPSSPSVPIKFAMITDQSVIVGPAPDAAYSVEVVGTLRPTPLSASNQSTYLTNYLPDLFLAESLIFGYGYLKDFGAMTDDPQGGATWTKHYTDLWQSANSEETRKRYNQDMEAKARP
jgi:hypothetical protein